MQKFNLKVFFCLFIFVLFANNPKAHGQSDELRERIESISDMINRAVVAGDYETILSYHTEDVILMPDFNPMIKRKKAWRRQIKKDRRRGLKFHSMNGAISDIWSGGDLVYERGTFGLSVTTTSTHQAVPIIYNCLPCYN